MFVRARAKPEREHFLHADLGLGGEKRERQNLAFSKVARSIFSSNILLESFCHKDYILFYSFTGKSQYFRRNSKKTLFICIALCFVAGQSAIEGRARYGPTYPIKSVIRKWVRPSENTFHALAWTPIY